MLVLTTQLLISFRSSAQNVHVFADSETSIFSELALNTHPNAVWSTDRSSTPGYFTAVDDAIYSGAADGTSHLVDGYVKYYRGTSATTGSFVFPVGNGTDYRPVIIGGTIPNNTTFATAWFAGDPGVTTDPTDGTAHNRGSKGTGVVSVLPQGFWDWQFVGGTANGLTISLSIPDVSTQAFASNLVLVGWDGSEWINLSGTAGAGPFGGNWADGNTEGSSLRGSWQAGISALGIGSLSVVLPLKLENFSGRANGCIAGLTWKTSEEENTSHFIIQCTIDGINWKQLGNVPAQGNGTGKTYSYSADQDEHTVRYRLCIADRDGKVKYSPIVTLTSQCGQRDHLKLFPNPVVPGSGDVKIIMQASRHGRATLLLRNITGEVVLNRSIVLTKGLNTVNLETGGFARGTYLLSVIDEKGQLLYQLQKIIK